MPAIDDDDKPKKKIAHEIGQDLTLLSVEELAARAQLLRDEIQRIEADMTQTRRALQPISFSSDDAGQRCGGIPMRRHLENISALRLCS